MSYLVIVLSLFIGVLSVLYLCYPVWKINAVSSVSREIKTSASSKSPLCQLLATQQIQTYESNLCENISERNNTLYSPRVVVVGDVHGSFTGLKEILFKADIIKSIDSCIWKNQEAYHNATILIQIGDIVDRGSGATEAWNCLIQLQSTAPSNSKVIRLVGNHEIWWMLGYFHMINKVADTKDKIFRLVKLMKQEIVSGLVQGAYTIKINGFPLLFTHAGIRPEFFTYLKDSIQVTTAEDIVTYINEKFVQDTKTCVDLIPCRFDDELYEAGPDRGGGGVGGPLWTDFRVLEKADNYNKLPTDLIQIVGHTASRCAVEEEDCIRHTSKMSAICVDGGMYLGSRSYLEILFNGTVKAIEKKSKIYDTWNIRDFTSLLSSSCEL